MNNLARSREFSALPSLNQIRNEQARRHLDKFTEVITPDEPPALHHKLLCDKLEAVERGDIPRLMVFMPPGSAKSKFCSWTFPGWYLGRNPTKNLITASYSGDLATKFGKRVRNTVMSREYEEIFNVRMSEDTKAKGEWETDRGGEYYACGVDGSVTGRRGDGGLIDDPVKGRKEADSEHIREVAWNWYVSDFTTRLKPDAWQIIIQTRWHEDDLSGRILPDDWSGESGWLDGKDGNRWYVLSIPAEARENDPLGRAAGEILWPEYLGPKLLEHKRSQSPRNWSALFQQVPSPDEGTYFQREWFNWYDEPPKHLRKYGSSDYAVTEDGDFTEHGVWGVDPDDNLYALDWWSGQEQSDVWIDAKLALIKKHKPIAWFGEAGQIRRAIEPFLKKRMRETKTYCRMEWVASTRDKPVRARGFQGRAAMGKVYLPNNEWGQRLLEQLLRFPAGTFDDAVDVCSLIGMVLDETHPALVPKSESKKRDRWADAFDKIDNAGESWKTA